VSAQVYRFLLFVYPFVSALSFTLSCQGKNRPLRMHLNGLSDPTEGERSRTNERMRNERRAKFSWPLPTLYFALACNFIAIARIVEHQYTAPYSGIRRSISFDLDTYFVVLDLRCSLLVWPHGGRQRSVPFANILYLAGGPVRHRTMRSGLITLNRPECDPPDILPSVVWTGQPENTLEY
jgi:hypothetical protein